MSDALLKERVARAINEGLGESWAYCNYSGNEWVQCRDMLDSAAELAIAAMSSPSHDRATSERDLAAFGASEASGIYAPADASLRRAFEDGAAFATTGKLPPTDGADRAMAEGGWQPIETAPKDGTKILAWSRNHTWIEPAIAYWGRTSPLNLSRWCGGHCSIGHIDQPTHWHPLPPAPPTPTTKEETA